MFSLGASGVDALEMTSSHLNPRIGGLEKMFLLFEGGKLTGSSS